MPLASWYLRRRQHIHRWLTRHGRWNADGLSVTMALVLERGDTFLDIGANVGWVTQAASYLVGEAGRVLSFEPSPSTANYLRHRISALGLRYVTVNEGGLGDAPGSAVLHGFDENHGGASSLRPGAWPGHERARETVAPIRVLDDPVVEQRAESVRLLKMGVQGAEVEALLEAIRAVRYEMLSWRGCGLVPMRTERDLPPGGHDDVICFRPGVHDRHKGSVAEIARRHAATAPTC
jgi:FkbM family methyltransferase